MSPLLSALVLLSLSGYFIIVETLKWNSKALPFYVIVKFRNETCYSPTFGTTGVCVRSNECERINGTALDDCAYGAGVCCYVALDCQTPNQIVTINGTHIVNPPFNNYQSYCSWSIPQPPGVCQVRLDFLKFNTPLAINPDDGLSGNCQADIFDIDGTLYDDYNWLRYCGNMTGQHVYLDYAYSKNNNFTMYKESFNGVQNAWDIKVTFIKCGSPGIVPAGCQQYFTEPSGIVKSYNYDGMQQLNYQAYTVCIKSAPDMTKISWSSCGGDYDFFVSGYNYNPPISNALTGDDCPLDWVQIFGVDKFCGDSLPKPVITSTSKPFLLYVNFNNYERTSDPMTDDLHNYGFCLKYATFPY